MKAILRLRFVLVFLALASSSCAAYDAPRDRGAQQKTAVCHKGKKTLWVAEPAVRAHLDHGDSLGRCR